MTHDRRQAAQIRLERLETRDLPSGNLDWPIAGDTPPILFTYGQFIEAATTGLHFHEGLDIIAPNNPPVRSVEAAKWWNGTNAGNASDHVELTTGDHGWSYVHATAVSVPIAGDILQGQQIATVATHPSYPDHLHLGRTDNTADPFNAAYLRPNGNPLDFLTSKDTVAPTVDPNGFRFRTAATDTNGTLTVVLPGVPSYAETPPRNHQYFQSFAPLNLPYVGAKAPTQDADANVGTGSTDIDVIANVYDQQIAGGRKLAPYSVSFRIIGDSYSTQGDDTGWVTPFTFTGEFLNRQSTNPKGHNYASLYDINLVRTVYEHDPQSLSQEAGDSFFILTNYSGDQKVDYYGAGDPQNDRARSWQSNVSRSAARQWYDILAEGDRATVNADSQFRDGFYKLKVWGQDASGNFDIKETRFLLVNFKRDFTATGTGATVLVDPDPNYLANDAVPIYDLTSPPQEGTVLTNQILTIPTDASGAMVPTTMTIASGHWYVADYDHDGVYYSPLDAILAVHTQGDGPVKSLLASPGDVDFHSAGFDGATLGAASRSAIRLDNGVAGWGEARDPMSWNDSETSTPGSGSKKPHMDFLTELENVIGPGPEQSGMLIDTLPAGTRRTPAAVPSSFNVSGIDWLSAFSGAVLGAQDDR